MDGWMYECIDAQTKIVWLDRQMNEWRNGWMYEWRDDDDNDDDDDGGDDDDDDNSGDDDDDDDDDGDNDDDDGCFLNSTKS